MSGAEYLDRLFAIDTILGSLARERRELVEERAGLVRQLDAAAGKTLSPDDAGCGDPKCRACGQQRVM